MEFILIFLAIYLVFVLGVGVTVHVFYSLGLVAIARHRNISRANLAWLPFIGTAYITGAIADVQVKSESGKDHKLKYWLLWMSLALLILMIVLPIQMFSLGNGYPDNASDPFFLVIMFLILIIGLPFTFCWYLAHYKLFKACQPNNSSLFLVLSIFFGIAPFLIFAVRHYMDGQRVAPSTNRHE